MRSPLSIPCRIPVAACRAKGPAVPTTAVTGRRETSFHFKTLTTQGQRTLKSFDTQDLHQEVIIPAAELAFHGEAFFAGVLLQE